MGRRVVVAAPGVAAFFVARPRLIRQSACFGINQHAASAWCERLVVRLESPVRPARIGLEEATDVRFAVRHTRQRALYNGRRGRRTRLWRKRRYRRRVLPIPGPWFWLELASCFFHLRAALVLEQAWHVFLPRERHRDGPRPREDIRIVDRRLVADRVGIDHRVALGHAQRVAVEIAGHSNQVWSRWFVMSTTSVSPSQRPRESPIQNSSGVDALLPFV